MEGIQDNMKMSFNLYFNGVAQNLLNPVMIPHQQKKKKKTHLHTEPLVKRNA